MMEVELEDLVKYRTSGALDRMKRKRKGTKVTHTGTGTRMESGIGKYESRGRDIKRKRQLLTVGGKQWHVTPGEAKGIRAGGKPSWAKGVELVTLDDLIKGRGPDLKPRKRKGVGVAEDRQIPEAQLKERYDKIKADAHARIKARGLRPPNVPRRSNFPGQRIYDRDA